MSLTARRTHILVVAMAALIAGLVLAAAIAFRSSDPNKEAARAAGTSLANRVAALAKGDKVDFAQAVGQPWERAVLMEAYMQGDEMNLLIGFQWYSEDDLSGSDETQRTLVFLAQKEVVAEVLLSPQTFRLDGSIVGFPWADATFIASRDSSGLVTLRHP
jgi:hypothetical protein